MKRLVSRELSKEARHLRAAVVVVVVVVVCDVCGDRK